MAGRSTALTAIFTPGYAAAEQMTSAKQGPWTDIYGLSATLYHAITGQTPPSAFDRMLDDAYEPLGKIAAAGLCAAACWPASMPASRCAPATGRNPSPAGGRSSGSSRRSPATRRSCSCRPPAPPPPASSSRSRRLRRAAGEKARYRPVARGRRPRRSWCWRGGYYALVGDKRRRSPGGGCVRPSAVDKAAQDAQLAAEAQRLKDQEELARLRAEAAAREKAEQEAAQRKQIEEETRRKIEAEMADKQRQTGRSAPEGGSRCGGQAQGRGGREEGGRGGRKRLAPASARPTAPAGRADRARFPHRRHRRKFRRAHARDDRGLAEDAQ